MRLLALSCLVSLSVAAQTLPPEAEKVVAAYEKSANAIREKAEREKTARDASRETVSVTPPVTDGETPAVTPSETSPVTSPAPVTPPPSEAVTASQAHARAPLPPPSLHPLRGMEGEGKGGARQRRLREGRDGQEHPTAQDGQADQREGRDRRIGERLAVVHMLGTPSRLPEIKAICDEHGILRKHGAAPLPALGETVWLIPGHCDPTVNLHEHYVVVRGGLEAGRVEAVWPIDARGCIR